MSITLSVLYCDDIRHEVGGKVSLMGIYGSHMLLDTLPATLPKLCVHFCFDIPKEVDANRVNIKLMTGGENLYNSDIQYSAPELKNDTEVLSRRLVGGFELNGVEFKDRSKLEFFAEVDEIPVRGADLIICTRSQYEEEANSNSG